jgi:hypothetical protein
MAGEDERVSTYAEFRDDVLPRIKAQGYTAVQLMAIQVRVGKSQTVYPRPVERSCITWPLGSHILTRHLFDRANIDNTD